MRFGYVVLYVNNPDACVEFWTKQVGMEVKNKTTILDFTIYRVGFEGEEVSIELVPLDMMRENPDGLDLATPSLCFYVPVLLEEHRRLQANKVSVTEIMQHSDRATFAFSDNEDRWFAVVQE